MKKSGSRLVEFRDFLHEWPSQQKKKGGGRPSLSRDNGNPNRGLERAEVQKIARRKSLVASGEADFFSVWPALDETLWDIGIGKHSATLSQCAFFARKKVELSR